jgi:hypothetical protein
VRSSATTFPLIGAGIRRLGEEVDAVTGIVASYPQGEGLRVITDPFGEEHLRRFPALHGAGVDRVATRTRYSGAFLWRRLLIPALADPPPFRGALPITAPPRFCYVTHRGFARLAIKLAHDADVLSGTVLSAIRADAS